jgi:uncharacterized protein YjdB
MKIFNRLFTALALLAAAICSCENPAIEETVALRLNKELISALNIGQTQKLEVTMTPADADVSLVWASDNESVAVVDEDGNVTGVAAGEATISVTANKTVAECKVKVVASKPEGIRLDEEDLDMEVGQTRRLAVAFTPEGSEATDMVWTSSNKSVASVEDGLVTAHAVGQTQITVKCNGGKLAAVCQVTVSEPRPDKIFVTSITMTSVLELHVGASSVLVPKVLPENADDRSVTFSVDGDCVSVDARTGEVVAIKLGTARVTAKANDGSGVKAECNVTVVDKPNMIESVAVFSVDNVMDVQVGKTLQLYAEYLPAGVKPNSVSWTVDNTSLATIDQNGLLKGVSAVKAADGEWNKVVVTVNADGIQASLPLRVIPRQPESIEVDVPENNQLRVGEQWDFNPRVLPEGLGYGVVCSIMKPGNNFTADHQVSSDIPGAMNAQFAVATHDDLVYTSYRKDVVVNVIPYWVETIALPSSQEMEVGGSIFLSPVFTSDVEGVQPTDKKVVWTSSDESKAVVNENGKVTAIASGTVQITVTTAGDWSVPSGQQHKSASCTVTIKKAEVNANVGDFYFSDGTTSPTLQAGKTVIGVVISRDNATSTDKKLPADCTHGVVLALGEGYGMWSSSYDAGRVNSWATQNGYENTTGTYYSNAQWTYVRNEYGYKYLGYNNTSAMKAYMQNNGYTSGILDALAAYQIDLPDTASELYIPSIAEMDAVVKNLEVINAALKAAGGTEFIMDTTDSQKDAYWTSSENEASSGNAATIDPFTGELHGGVMKSKEKKVRFIFAF